MIPHRSIALLLLLASTSSAAVIDFESLPNDYMFLGGGQNIGSYYSGVTFGPNVTGLDLTGNSAYPPHSGSIAVWDPYDITVTITFAVPQATVGVWYTSIDLLTLTAYDDTNALLSSITGPANTDGATGTSDFLSLTIPNISTVSLQGPPGGYVFDDATFSQTANSAPEPSNTPCLLLGVVVLFTAIKIPLQPDCRTKP